MKILFFYPENPTLINQGNNSRANKLLQYFKSRNIDVDFVGENAKNGFAKKHIDLLKQQKLINNGFLINPGRNKGLNYLFRDSIPNKFSKARVLFGQVTHSKKKAFEAILKDNKYDYIIISYVLYSNFINNKKLLKGAKTIVDTHDFFTAQFFSPKIKLGSLFETEIALLNKFDTIWCISNEEQFVFSQFLPKKNIITVPHGVKYKGDIANSNFPIDVFYIASDNPHNIKSATWFFSEVYPLLPNNINFTVVGRICDYIPDLHNVVKINFYEDIDSLYKQCKVTICPMLSGTGLKIKVVESLSHGKPVVCNERGLDGLPYKVNNGCLTSNNKTEFANFIIELLSNKTYYKIQTENAEKMFKNFLDEKVVFKNLDSFFLIDTHSTTLSIPN